MKVIRNLGERSNKKEIKNRIYSQAHIDDSTVKAIFYQLEG